jgi:oxygen-independent coproporphyrinogen-3 oxidase
LKISDFRLNRDEQVIVKVSKEILTLYHISVEEGSDDADYEVFDLHHDIDEEKAVVHTVLSIIKRDGTRMNAECTTEGSADEAPRAEVHRLVKLNFYHLLHQLIELPPAPWGILHGVRPTKIVHRYIKKGLAKEAVIRRLMTDFEVSREKAELITELAYYQQPFLEQTTPKTVSIYVGIPFCLSRCLYCSFPANVLPANKELDRFMAAFQRDLDAVKRAVDTYGFTVQNIYIGGGTPTSLPDDYFEDMMQHVVSALYHPGVEEFTVEAGRPDSMSPAKIACMVKYKVDRVSVNPQTMQQRTLKRIGRQHTPEDIVTMYRDLREAGIPSINMDLIVGLPGEGPEDMRDTIDKVLALGPEDVTLHALALKRGSLLKMNLDETELPDDKTVQEMFDIALSSVVKSGRRPYYLYRQGYQSGQMENIGCCVAGAESLYNIQIMEEHQTILGIGGAATSKIVNPKTMRLKTSFNAKDLAVYLDRVDTYIEKRDALLAEAYGGEEE